MTEILITWLKDNADWIKPAFAILAFVVAAARLWISFSQPNKKDVRELIAAFSKLSNNEFGKSDDAREASSDDPLEYREYYRESSKAREDAEVCFRSKSMKRMESLLVDRLPSNLLYITLAATAVSSLFEFDYEAIMIFILGLCLTLITGLAAWVYGIYMFISEKLSGKEKSEFNIFLANEIEKAVEQNYSDPFKKLDWDKDDLFLYSVTKDRREKEKNATFFSRIKCTFMREPLVHISISILLISLVLHLI